MRSQTRNRDKPQVPVHLWSWSCRDHQMDRHWETTLLLTQPDWLVHPLPTKLLLQPVLFRCSPITSTPAQTHPFVCLLGYWTVHHTVPLPSSSRVHWVLLFAQLSDSTVQPALSSLHSAPRPLQAPVWVESWGHIPDSDFSVFSICDPNIMPDGIGHTPNNKPNTVSVYIYIYIVVLFCPLGGCEGTAILNITAWQCGSCMDHFSKP